MWAKEAQALEESQVLLGYINVGNLEQKTAHDVSPFPPHLENIKEWLRTALSSQRAAHRAVAWGFSLPVWGIQLFCKMRQNAVLPLKNAFWFDGHVSSELKRASRALQAAETSMSHIKQPKALKSSPKNRRTLCHILLALNSSAGFSGNTLTRMSSGRNLCSV